MSTQKRECRSIPGTEICRRGYRRRQQPLDSAERAGENGTLVSAPFARHVCALAGGGTAPLWSIVWSALAWLATKFLQSDQPLGKRVRPAFEAERTGSPPPPPSACRLAVLGKPVSPRSSLPPIPFPSGYPRLHVTLPQDPAADQRRAERYDGKRDLYFLYAA